MKYETTLRFDNDFRDLRREHRKRFLDLIAEFSTACDEYTNDPARHVWPKRLRVRQLTSVKGIWEMTALAQDRHPSDLPGAIATAERWPRRRQRLRRRF